MTIALLQIANLQQPARHQRANLVAPMKWKLLVQFPESPRSEGEDIHFYYSNFQTVAKVHQYFHIVGQDLGLRHREVGSIENDVAVVAVEV